MLKNIRIVALASFIEGLTALVWLASIPTGGKPFSPIRLVSLFIILINSLGCLAILVNAKAGNRATKIIEGFVNSRAGRFISFPLIAISLVIWVTILYKEWLLLSISESAYIRLLPIALFGALLCLQVGILFFTPHTNINIWEDIFRPVWKPALILLGSFLGVWIFVSATQIGITSDVVGLNWGPPGTPISFPQVILVFAVSLSLTFVYNIFKHRVRLQWLPIRDILIFLGLWSLAVILWWNEPVSATHFNPPPMPPNNEYYPNSDALIFDRSAYHLIYGTGFGNHLIRRPLYAGMLALFHKMAGPGYDNTIFLQILILALIPSMIYLVTSKLSNRLAGLIAGGLILLREKNAIELSDKIVTSNAKLMMSDMIAMLGVIAIVYVTIKLFSKKERSVWFLGIVGACLGLTALVRAQVLILIPVLFLFIFMDKKPLKLRVRDSVFIMLGLTLAMLPWVWRNWNLTGTFVLDDRGEERLLARNYSSSPFALPSPLPAETEQEFSSRLKRDVFTFMIEHPSDVVFFVSNHFFRTMATSTVYIAPTYSTTSPWSLVDETSFWEDWQGRLTGNSGASLFVNLAIVALGISIAQTKNKRAGWFPVVAFLAYSGGNALVRSSGWRFSLPADWVILVYYGIALAYLPYKIMASSKESPATPPEIESIPVHPKNHTGIIIFCALLLLGGSVPIAEKLIPAKDFSNFTDNAQQILSRKKILSQTDIESFMKQGNAVFYSGMALYPRHIKPNSRIYLADAPPRDYKYLHFWLINDDDTQIVFPMESSPPVFPHTATVSVIGCKEDNYILAWAVILHTPSGQVYVQDSKAPLSCSLTSSE